MGAGGREVGLAVAAGRQNGVGRLEPVDGAVLQAEGDDAAALAVLHQQVQGEVLDEVVAVVPEKLVVSKNILVVLF